MKKSILIGIGIIVVAGLIIMIRNRSEVRDEGHRAHPIVLEARGMLSYEQEDGLLLITTAPDTHFILEGEHTEQLMTWVGEELTVRGRIKFPDPETVNEKPIRYNITVEDYFN